MLNSDSHFQIGYSHYVCEDYALSGVSQDGSFHYAIVSDGCSSSQDTDIGARILAKCAVDAINYLVPNCKWNDVLYYSIGLTAIQNAQRVIRSLGLPNSALDATLLIAITTEELYSYVLFYGDGVVCDKSSMGTTIYNIEFPSGAPYYLSYLLDTDRQKLYFDTFGDKYTVRSNGIDELNEFSILDSPYWLKWDYPNGWEVPRPKIIAVLSDGVGTYHNKNVFDAVSELTEFKNTNGLFVKRRMNALKRVNDKLGIVHDDDVSMAVICNDGKKL